MNNIIESYRPKFLYLVLYIGKYIYLKYEDYCLAITQKKKYNIINGYYVKILKFL